MKAKKSLWNDTFKIDITFPARSYTDRSNVEALEFTGSLKGAIRMVMNDYGDRDFVANFYTSDNEWIKEIGV
ncbi:hypothetical protein TSARBOMBA_200 [Bacillus phage TsarBomba]|uniref:Uncharacterized protein n=1 Tax=Bacillus phage TsarBomba TaxID=1690456 RepID=A0A0K2D0N5_9CAUD|nr:hypothetical protein TSARBOMBA_200 [Bacillus phage TsarBomba]ALA13232.1 hypothetical protein TSARBOMBA_200 [Bacillus phage TsarBomba]